MANEIQKGISISNVRLSDWAVATQLIIANTRNATAQIF